MEQKEDAVPPKVPDRTQQGAEQTEKQHSAAEDTHHHIQPQLSGAEGHGKIKYCGKGYQTVQHIYERQSPLPYRQAERAQQVVQQAQQRPKQP